MGKTERVIKVPYFRVIYGRQVGLKSTEKHAQTVLPISYSNMTLDVATTSTGNSPLIIILVNKLL
jgi:hypothetical protein